MNALPALVIRPASETSPCTEWLCAGEITRMPEADALTQLAALAETHQVCLLLPVSWLTFCHFPLPPQGSSMDQNAIAWQLEDQLFINSETLHWTVLEIRDAQCYVVGVERQKLALLLETYRMAGITVATAAVDGGYLPVVSDGWSAVACDSGWLVRHSEFTWSFLNAALFSQLASRFLKEKTLICYGATPEGVHADSRDALSPLQLYEQAMTTPPVNLLHGEFQVVPPASQVPLVWRKRLLGFAAAAVLVYLGSQAALAGYLWQQQQEQQRMLQASWQRYFPGDKHQGNYRFFFRQKVKIPSPDPLTRLRQLEKILRTTPDVALGGFAANKESGELILTVNAADPASVNTLIDNSSNSLMLQATSPASGTVHTLTGGGRP